MPWGFCPGGRSGLLSCAVARESSSGIQRMISAVQSAMLRTWAVRSCDETGTVGLLLFLGKAGISPRGRAAFCILNSVSGCQTGFFPDGAELFFTSHFKFKEL